MPDVFISYARRDAELVRRLHGKLVEHGNNVWVDWEDIPPASKFERDLEEGVAKSDSFVFVISPDSLDSSYCRKELAYADERNKRIVPVIHREVDRERLPESLRVRNWIPSGGRFEDDFDAGVAALVSAIETDLEWVRAHTEWGAQAEEWRTNDRDRSFLLRGTELAAAERWIAQQGKEPAPTGLQGEYVLASRRAASRRQRLTLAATGAALIVAVGLAIIAVVQRNEAVSQRDQALSRVLAESARDNLTVDPELAMLLALEAVDVRATPEAEASLRQALGAWRVRLLIRDHEGPVWRGAFSPDGELIATGESDSAVHVSKADTGEPVQTFHGRGRIAALGFSRDGDLVVAVPDHCGNCNGYSSTGTCRALGRGRSRPASSPSPAEARYVPGRRRWGCRLRSTSGAGEATQTASPDSRRGGPAARDIARTFPYRLPETDRPILGRHPDCARRAAARDLGRRLRAPARRLEQASRLVARLLVRRCRVQP